MRYCTVIELKVKREIDEQEYTNITGSILYDKTNSSTGLYTKNFTVSFLFC